MRMALMAFVAIACSQLALAGHQFEHDIGGITDVCGVCAGLQNLDAPSPSIIRLAPPAKEFLRADFCGSGRLPTAAPAPYAVRAPPRLD